MNTYRIIAIGGLVGSIFLSACQQNIPAPVVVAPVPQLPPPVVAPAPKAQPKKVTPKPRKQVKEEEDLVPVLPLRPNQVGSRASILP